MSRHSYYFVVQPSHDGPVIRSWYEAIGKESTDAANYFAMSISAKVNRGTGPLLVHCGEEQTCEEMESQLRAMSPEDLRSFFAEADARPDNIC